jgi:arylsulfatase A-like enzyme
VARTISPEPREFADDGRPARRPGPARPGRPLPLATALLAAALAGCGGAWGGSSPTRPSVVLVVWDTCRGDRIAVHGYPNPTTPRLSELAARGVAWSACFTPAPWTPPAHASLFTGALPRHHGLVEGLGDRPSGRMPLLAQTLRAGGYETVCFSANPAVSGSTGLQAGFETYSLCALPRAGLASGDLVAETVRAWAASRAASDERRPFFLFLNLMETHLPYRFTPADVAAVHGADALDGAHRAAESVGDVASKSYTFGREDIPPETLRGLGVAYDASVRRVDAITGGILDDLRAAGLLEGALVAVTGDHGENLGEHRELNHVASVYDPVLRVPLVVHWPGRFEGGVAVDRQVRLQDLYATILDAAELDPPDACGTDSLPLETAPGRPRVLVAEFGPIPRSLEVARPFLPGLPESGFERFHHRYTAVRDPDTGPRPLKYIVVRDTAPGREEALVREELYDLAADPGETRNLLAPGAPPFDPGALARLRRLSGRWR